MVNRRRQYDFGRRRCDRRADHSDPAIAAAIAVSSAILGNVLLRCLHPPGGAAALSAVLGGYALFSAHAISFLTVVFVNSLLLVSIGWLFHRFSGHSYPHRAKPVGGRR